MATVSGSPPREWGRHDDHHGPHPRTRFTPTRVGKTSCDTRFSASATVHPHASGEDPVSPHQRRWYHGSPPREWGRPRGRRRGRRDLRFTPTRVGKTARSCPTPRRSSVHPHASGEDSSALSASAPSSGSPPREWGRRPRAGGSGQAPRFTPTRVGKTASRSPTPPSASVHPHASGEDSLIFFLSRWRAGSPPREWGRPPRRAPPSPGRRFTPTRVGKTRCPGPSGSGSSVHPHASGEDVAVAVICALLVGSPPREWGRQPP